MEERGFEQDKVFPRGKDKAVQDDVESRWKIQKEKKIGPPLSKRLKRSMGVKHKDSAVPQKPCEPFCNVVTSPKVKSGKNQKKVLQLEKGNDPHNHKIDSVEDGRMLRCTTPKISKILDNKMNIGGKIVADLKSPKKSTTEEPKYLNKTQTSPPL